ncbi:hypothetical protein I6J72_05485 [Corynebacterium sp. FDAARGOS 1242]|uniref:Uncharacterized protein n=1 Tax=Corynebacterium minutissimum TaxID=38301 RepID=A0A376CXF2_9CORY|nr:MULTISPECIES: hypothetical protein [Corynebacterium]QRP60871.1 hypothetical protein I6J26_12105 [Corynebacterium minutissimum]QRP98952.1 hypothetical protein I6J72_05485 [Corynebacterium sp. FDAARGOS 1242]STC77503.1 Uncharacterised protein [Corynebacterium minutissimum]
MGTPRELRPYSVPVGSGLEFTLMLSPETAARHYPDAREVKVAPVEVKADKPRRGRPRKNRAASD